MPRCVRILSFLILALVQSASVLAIQPALPTERTHHVEDPDLTTVLMAVDRAFSARAQETDVPTAFLEYAAEDAVMYRNGMEPIIGKAAIAELLAPSRRDRLVWVPLTADVSASLDLGYTRGSFTLYPAPAEDGTPANGPLKGYYVSIWKRQADGSWKWVFDSGVISQIP